MVAGRIEGGASPAPIRRTNRLKPELRFLLLLLGLFGFFDGFAEVGDGGDIGGFEDVFALGAPADVAVDDLGAGGASHIGTGAVAGAVDDEAVLGDGGADFGLLFGVGVLRHGLVG